MVTITVRPTIAKMLKATLPAKRMPITLYVFKNETGCYISNGHVAALVGGNYDGPPIELFDEQRQLENVFGTNKTVTITIDSDKAVVQSNVWKSTYTVAESKPPSYIDEEPLLTITDCDKALRGAVTCTDKPFNGFAVVAAKDSAHLLSASSYTALRYVVRVVNHPECEEQTLITISDYYVRKVMQYVKNIETLSIYQDHIGIMTKDGLFVYVSNDHHGVKYTESITKNISELMQRSHKGANVPIARFIEVLNDFPKYKAGKKETLVAMYVQNGTLFFHKAGQDDTTIPPNEETYIASISIGTEAEDTPVVVVDPSLLRQMRAVVEKNEIVTLYLPTETNKTHGSAQYSLGAVILKAPRYTFLAMSMSI